MKDKYLRKLKVELIDGEYENCIEEQVRDPKQVYELFGKLKDEMQETLLGLYLKPDMQAHLYSILSLGSTDHALVVPKDIYKAAIITNSDRFILVHNHPKGDPKPSEGDNEVIEAITRGAKEIDLVFLDFIIVGDESYWSMFEEADGGEYALGSTK